MKQKLCFLVSLMFIGISLYGQNNTDYGTYAGNSGLRNSSFGYYAGDAVTGMENVFFGTYSGRYSTTEDFNASFGYASGYQNTTGYKNSNFGAFSGRYGVSTVNNSSIGYKAGYYSTVSYNILLGSYANYSNGTGERNVMIGFKSGYSADGSYNVFLGYNAGYYETDSYKLYLENSSSSSPLIYGEFDNDFVTINGNLGVGTSDIPDTISLLVDSLIIAKEAVIKTETFPDYVFEEDYCLMPLKVLESSILSEGHLPGISSGEEIVSIGIDTGALSIQLLEKIEELTLYLVELNREIELEKTEQQRLMQQVSKLQLMGDNDTASKPSQ